MIGLGRLYAVEFHGASLGATTCDFFYIKPAADKICIVEAIYLGIAGGTNDAGDAKEQLLDLEMIYLPSTVTAGSGGVVANVNAKMVNDTAASFTARTNDSTLATTNGTAVNRHSDTMNARVPYVYLPPPEHRDVVANAAAIVFRLKTTPTSVPLAINGTCLIREMP